MRAQVSTDDPDEQPLVSNRLLFRGTVFVACLAALTLAISTFGERYGHELALGGHTDSTEGYRISIGADDLTISANMIRFGEQRHSGPAEQLNLYLAWPEMSGYSPALQNRFDDLDQSNGLIFLQLSEATMSRDMSGRLEPIYSRLFAGDPQPGPQGLTLHHMRAESGYGDEVIMTASRPGQPDYAVRCILPKTGNGSTSADCQRDIHVGQGISVLCRFSSTLLPQWDHIDAAVSRFVLEHIAARQN